MNHGKDEFSSYGVKGILSALSENIVKYKYFSCQVLTPLFQSINT